MIYHISPPPSSYSQPATPSPFFSYKRLCSIAIFGALLYVSGDIAGYNRGAKNNVRNNKGSLRAASTSSVTDISASSWTKRMNDQNDDAAMMSGGKVPSGDDEPVSTTHEEVEPGSITTDKNATASMKKNEMLQQPKISSSVANARVTSINLIGERHSGTNWITDHLIDCVSMI